MKKVLSLLLCLCLMAGLFAGCASENTPYVPTGDALLPEDADLDALESEKETAPQELSLVYYADRSMNPLSCTDFTNRVLFSLIYQGLFSVSSSNEAVPILCKEFYTTSDQRSYTVFLEDAVFSDGSRVTLDDVLATYEAAQKSAYYSGRFGHVRSIALSSDGGITFNLDTPMENFLLLLDVPILKASQLEDENPLGTGPYILDSSLGGVYLRRNTAWWCSSPDLVVTADSVLLVPAESPTHIRDQFEFADVGLVCADPCSDGYADYRCDYELWDCENGIMMYLGCNVGYEQKGKKSTMYFKNDNVRTALTYAIDRQALVDENYRSYAKPTALAVSPGSPYYSPGLEAKYSYDPVRLINAINNAGTPKDPIRLLVNRDDSLRLRTARRIAEMLQECGLAVELVERSTNDFVQYVKAGNFDLYLGQTKLSANMDLSAFYRPWGNLTWGNTSNANLYELCQKALENEGNYYDLHKAVAEDGKIIPIMFLGYAIYATRGLLTDLQPSRDNVFFYTLGRTDSDAEIPAG